MIAILKAFRDALVADATLIGMVPASNIYVGLRDEKTPIPAIDIFQVSKTTDKYAGAQIGGMTKANVVVQVSVFDISASDVITIADRIETLLLGDNITLNTAGIRNVTMVGSNSLMERNMSHIPLRFSFNYHYTIT